MSTILWLLAITLIALRTIYRRKSGAKLHLDDIAMLVDGVLITALQVLNIVQVRSGIRPDLSALQDKHGGRFLLSVWIATLLFIWSSGVVKLSLLLYWLRICDSIGSKLRRLKTCLRVLLYVNIFLLAAGTISSIFSCWPVSTFWKAQVYEAHPDHCVNRDIKFFAGNCVNAIMNLIFAIVPIPIVRACSAMYVTWQKKILVAMLYGLGILLVFTSIMPIVALKALHFTWLDPSEPIAVNLGVIVWLVLEVLLTPVVACIPTLMPFYHSVGRMYGEVKDRFLSRFSRHKPTTENDSIAPIIELTTANAETRSRASEVSLASPLTLYSNPPPLPIDKNLPGLPSPRLQSPEAVPASPRRMNRLGSTAKSMDPRLLEKIKSVVYET